MHQLSTLYTHLLLPYISQHLLLNDLELHFLHDHLLFNVKYDNGRLLVVSQTNLNQLQLGKDKKNLIISYGDSKIAEQINIFDIVVNVKQIDLELLNSATTASTNNFVIEDGCIKCTDKVVVRCKGVEEELVILKGCTIRCTHSNQAYLGVNLVGECKYFEYGYKSPVSFDSYKNNLSLFNVKCWDEIFEGWHYLVDNIVLDKMEKPIDLRHPIIFYVGHIVAFIDMSINKHLKRDVIDNYYTSHFERGIDPDVDNPNKCHDHSKVPDQWPSYRDLAEYENKVRLYLKKCINDNKLKNRRFMRILFMMFEHLLMHMETLVYMLVQGNRIKHIEDKSVMFKNLEEEDLLSCQYIEFDKGTIETGIDDYESWDYLPYKQNDLETPLGWDNEMGLRHLEHNKFKIANRQISNKEYLKYIKATKKKTIPAQWIYDDKENSYYVKTLLGPKPLSIAKNWPVMLSYEEADHYAQYYNLRLPTEAELLKYRQHTINHNKNTNDFGTYNVGFKHFHPVSMNNNKMQFGGSGWEWTSSVFQSYEGYKQSELYKGYSADFFDNKHMVMLGGSYVSHPCFANRLSFRNWYQYNYKYVFGTFRCVVKE